LTISTVFFKLAAASEIDQAGPLKRALNLVGNSHRFHDTLRFHGTDDVTKASVNGMTSKLKEENVL
jgi:hypothetical protein